MRVEWLEKALNPKHIPYTTTSPFEVVNGTEHTSPILKIHA